MRNITLRIPETVFVDAFGAEERHVEIPAGNFFERTVASDHRVTRQEQTTGNVDLDARER